MCLFLEVSFKIHHVYNSHLIAQTVKNLRQKACNAGGSGSTPGCEEPLEKGMTTHSVFLPGNPTDRGACWAAVHGVAERSDMTE